MDSCQQLAWTTLKQCPSTGSITVRYGPPEFETYPDRGAIKIAVSILYFTGDPNSTLELAVHLWPNIPDARQSIPYPANPLKVNLLSAISAAIGN